MYSSVERVCEYCHEPFLGSKLRKYCGYNCSHSSRKRRVTLVCKECGIKFERQEWNNDAKFCGWKCKVKNQSSEIIDITCTNCNKEFKRKDNLKIKNKSGHLFCSKECADNFNKGSNHYEWKENLHDKHYKLALKQWGVIIKERDKYICRKCGETNKDLLESHHIKNRSKFPELQFDYDNGITLCLKCHALEHISDPKSFRLITYKINNFNINN